METETDGTTAIRYQVNEKPPLPIAIGLGAQLAVLTIGGIIITPMIVVQAGGGSESFLNWAVFAALAISGITTVIQAVRVGRIGAGYVLAMGTSGAFIAICATALAKGGPGMLATLVLVSSLFQFVLSERLSWFRKIFTSTVSGTVIMLIPVTVMPIIFDMMDDVPEGASTYAGPLCIVISLVFILVISLKAEGMMRLWALVVGVFAGTVAGLMFGIYDVELVASAKWIGLPDGSWGGFDLDFGPLFWTLLPGFIFVTLIGAIETIGDSVAIQRVSWRENRAIDFRAVQGAVAADGLGNLLSGLAGTVPNTTYSSSVSVTELTGVASRIIGVFLGCFFVVVAFSPKFAALIIAIPGPVIAAYATVILAMLFVVGMKVLIQDGVSYRKAIIAGTAFWAGVGFQNNWIFPELLTDFAGGLLQNGMTTGGMVAIALTMFTELTKKRAVRLETVLEPNSLPKIGGFFASNASRFGWSEAMLNRLQIVSEEVLLLIAEHGGQGGQGQARRLLITVNKDGSDSVLEFVSTYGDENFQDRLALIGEQMTESSLEKEFSLRILKHYASSVRHQQYFDTDVITVKVPQT